jgi:hypothetical protein
MAGVGFGSFLSVLTAGRIVDVLGPTGPARVGGFGALALGLGMFVLLPKVDVASRRPREA